MADVERMFLKKLIVYDTIKMREGGFQSRVF